MESFVPFGGFFSTPPDLKSPLTSSYQCLSRCHLCNEKCEQEVNATLKGGFSSVADQYQSILPSWLQVAELSSNRVLDVLKAKDDGLVLNAKVTGLQRKWDSICQHHHQTQSLPQADIHQVGSHVPSSVGLQVIYDKNEKPDNYNSNSSNASPNASGGKTVNSCMSMDLQKVCSSDERFRSEVSEEPSKTEDLELVGLRSPPMSSSPSSATSVTTDLGLGLSSESTIREHKKGTSQPRIDIDLVTASNYKAQSLSRSCPDLNGPYDQRDFKTLYKALSEKISWQEEAASVICQTIVRCRTRNHKYFGSNPRGDIWFNFLGPDKLGKKRTAIALAEILYGSSENFVCVDLSTQCGIIYTKSRYASQEVNGYDPKFRGKTVVDYIAAELSRNPLSVVLLENIDFADVLTQNSLSQAVHTGRFSDTHGKEVSINNAVFVTTSSFTKGNKILSSMNQTGKYSEERILRAKGQPIKILVGSALGDDPSEFKTTRNGTLNPICVNKRKSTVTNETIEGRRTSELVKRAHKTSSNLLLDLNLPAEETDGNYESDYVWLEDFTGQLDETVVFKPFDFDALAEKILKEISECFHKIVGLECVLEIDSKVMEQIVAAVCTRDKYELEDWVQEVLRRAFLEARKRYNLTTCSVVKLVTSEGLSLEEEEPGIHFPARIDMELIT